MSLLSYPFRVRLLAVAPFYLRIVVRGFPQFYCDQIAATVPSYFVRVYRCIVLSPGKFRYFFKIENRFCFIYNNLKLHSRWRFFKIGTGGLCAYFKHSFFLNCFNWPVFPAKKNILLVANTFKINGHASKVVKAIFKILGKGNGTKGKEQQGKQFGFHGFKKLGFKVLDVLANSVPALYPNVQRI